MCRDHAEHAIAQDALGSSLLPPPSTNYPILLTASDTHRGLCSSALFVSREMKLMQEMDSLSSPGESRAVAGGSEIFTAGLWFGEWLKNHRFWQRQMVASRDEIFSSFIGAII